MNGLSSLQNITQYPIHSLIFANFSFNVIAMGDFVLREIFTSGTRGMQDAIFLLSQPESDKCHKCTARIITGKLANYNDGRKFKAAVIEIWNRFVSTEEIIFACTCMSIISHIFVYRMKYLNGSLKMGHQTYATNEFFNSNLYMFQELPQIDRSQSQILFSAYVGALRFGLVYVILVSDKNIDIFNITQWYLNAH